MKNTNLPTEADCRRTATTVHEILPYIFTYGDRKKLIDRSFKEYHLYDDVWADFPDEWEGNTLGMLALSVICGRRKICAAFVRSAQDQLADQELKIARAWREIPWVWAIYEACESIGGNRLRIRPFGAPPREWPESLPWEELALYSPSVSTDLEHGYRIFFSQLFYAHGIFHTYGTIIPFRSFDENDLYAFADYVRIDSNTNVRVIEPLAGVAENAWDLSDIIDRNPIPFLRLFAYADAPVVSGKLGEWRREVSMVSLPEIDKLRDPDYLTDRIGTSRLRVCDIRITQDAAAIYLSEGSPLYDPAVYISYPARRMYLTASNHQAYSAGRESLLPLVELPVDPQVDHSMQISSVVRSILDVEDEVMILQTRADLEPDLSVPAEGAETVANGAVPTRDDLDMILQRLTYNHNEGIDESDEEISQALGIGTAIVANIRNTIEGMFGGGLDDDASDRLGLSPKAFHQLSSNPIPSVENTFRIRSALEFMSRESTLDEIVNAPMIRFANWLIDTAAVDGRIPATSAGYVKPSVILDAIDAGVVKTPEEQVRDAFEVPPSKESIDKMIDILKPKRELDKNDFFRRRQLVETSGLLRLSRDSFIVTDKARELKSNPAAMYFHLLESMLRKFPWDQSTRFVAIPHLSEYASLLLYSLVKTFRNSDNSSENTPWEPFDAMVDTFIGAVPFIREAIKNDTDSYFPLREAAATHIRIAFIDFLCRDFGLVETRKDLTGIVDGDPLHFPDEPGWLVRPSRLFTKVFCIGA